MSDKSAVPLIQNLNINLLELDLKNNNIGPKGCNSLNKFIPKSNLQYINIEDNNIGDIGAGIII